MTDFTTDDNMIKHAEHLLNKYGSCDGFYTDCEDCFVLDYIDDYDECSPEIAFEAAEGYLAGRAQCGRCKSIW